MTLVDARTEVRIDSGRRKQIQVSCSPVHESSPGKVSSSHERHRKIRSTRKCARNIRDHALSILIRGADHFNDPRLQLHISGYNLLQVRESEARPFLWPDLDRMVGGA